MAIVKSGTARSFRGKVGDKIYRKVNGKTVVGRNPEFINISNSQNSLKRRHLFKITEDLAKTIKSDDILYGIWDKMEPEGANKFSRIMKANLSHTTFKGLTRANVITPHQDTVPYRYRKYCTRLSKKSIVLTDNNLYAEMRVHRTNGEILISPYKAFFLVFLGRQNNPDALSEYEILPYDINVEEESPDKYQRYEIAFDNGTKKLISSFDYAVVFFALAGYNQNVNKFEWSETESVEVTLR